MSDYTCEACEQHAMLEAAEDAMLRAAARGDEQNVERHAARMKRLEGV